MTKFRWALVAASVCLAGAGGLGFRAGGQELTPRLPPAVPTTRDVVRPPESRPATLTYDRTEPATISTDNFQVTASSVRVARLVADMAERVRKEVAIAWLGKPLPRRLLPCVIVVAAGRGSTGATTFHFEADKVSANMRVEGELDRVLTDVVPREVTHTVLADHFKGPLPRWADEGVSLLSESDEERTRHLQIARSAGNAGKFLQLRALFDRHEFPDTDVAVFHAQSYCVARFLVEKMDRPTFIQFVAAGRNGEWEQAAKQFYGVANLKDLEREFLDNFKKWARSLPPEKSHAGAPNHPVLTIATIDDGGRIVVGSNALTYQPITTYQRRSAAIDPDARPVVASHFEPVTSYQLVRDSLSRPQWMATDIKAFTGDGKPISTTRLVELLRTRPTPVVVAPDWEQIGGSFSELLKPGAIVLVPPRTQTVPAAPASLPDSKR